MPALAMEALLSQVRGQFALAPDGLHGQPHWDRVLRNGRQLALMTGADSAVIELFALLHDSKRRSEAFDDGHGARAAEYAAGLAGTAFDLMPEKLAILCDSIRHHSDGLTCGDITTLCCWDADRLDLGRTGTRPRAERMGTVAAGILLQLGWLRKATAEGLPDIDVMAISRFQAQDMVPVRSYLMVSISDPGQKPPTLPAPSTREGLLQVAFGDGEKPGDSSTISEEVANQIARFVVQRVGKVELVVCHCGAGINRSAGVAGAISGWLGGKESSRWVFDNPRHNPNRTVYRKVLMALQRESGQRVKPC